MKTIFVQIASYRDPECQWTVKDLFAKARQPERIHVGICWQYDPEHDADCFKFAPNSDQVRISPFHWSESEGVCWARHEAQQLYDGEDYVLFIDSHMRFADGWDALLIEQLKQCPSEKSVLSNHPASYTPPDTLESGAMPTVLRAHLYSPQGDLRIRGLNLSRAPEAPLRGAFCAGGFMFAPGDIVRDVAYDPYLYFDQEEISLSARLYTHGYDVYSLKNVLLYHYYRDGAKGDTPHPSVHWDDNPGWLKYQERGRKRLNHLLGHTRSENPHIIRDIEKYSLGTLRSLADYQTFCGIDFQRKTVGDKALRCGFIAHLDRYLDGPIHVPEIDNVPHAAEQVETPAEVRESQGATASFDQPLAIERLMKTEPHGAKLNIDKEAPEGVMIVYDYADKKTCTMLQQYADSQTFTDLDVVNPEESTADKIVTKRDDGRITNHVNIDGKAHEILTIFNDIYCNRMAAFYNVDFEWYERPQILRYPPGGKYDRHADSEHWEAETDSWHRVQDRDYSVLLYLNDEYEGGEIELVSQNFRIKPKPGMLLAFPSDHRYLHAALPTTSGLRYVIVSWAAAMGTKRIRQMPFASIYIRQKRSS